MKVWQRIAAVTSLGLFMSLFKSGTAMAQDNNPPISILSDIFVPLLVIIDELLDYWVNSTSGNSLTSWGTSLVSSLATLIQEMIKFYAQFSLLLPSNNL